MSRLRVTAVRTILLASNLGHRLTRRAYLVDHPIFGFAFSNLHPYNRNFFLGYPDWLVALGTKIVAHLSDPTATIASPARALGSLPYLRKDHARPSFVSGFTDSHCNHRALVPGVGREKFCNSIVKEG